MHMQYIDHVGSIITVCMTQHAHAADRMLSASKLTYVWLLLSQFDYHSQSSDLATIQAT